MPDSKDLKDLDSQLKKTIISAESFKRGSSVAFDASKNILNPKVQKTLSKLVENVRNLLI
jgi:outer membrane protein OmpA-like peptidoglycan-associated protein